MDAIVSRTHDGKKFTLTLNREWVKNMKNHSKMVGGFWSGNYIFEFDRDGVDAIAELLTPIMSALDQITDPDKDRSVVAIELTDDNI